MTELWARMLAALGPRAERLKLRFAATDAEIDAAEAALGFALPHDYRALLQISDGQDAGGLSIFPVCAWLSPLRRVVDEWKRQVAEPAHYTDACLLPDEPHLRCRMAPRERITIAHWRSEPACALRLAGSAPPELLAAWDDQHHVVLAPSLSRYLQALVVGLEAGELAPITFDYTGAQTMGHAAGATWTPWRDGADDRG